MNKAAKITVEMSFEDFNAVDILVQQEILRVNTGNSDVRRGPSLQAWRNRLRVMSERIALMRPPGYAEQIRQAHERLNSVCDA
jgi:hypothetical protein